MRTDSFDYFLPEELIAQEPLPERDRSRLMVVDRATGRISHRLFRDILELLEPGDLLVLNTTRVFPARLKGVKSGTGGRVELLLTERKAPASWTALAGGARLKPGTVVEFPGGTLRATVSRLLGQGRVEVVFECEGGSDPDDAIRACGEVPLPPYIKKKLKDPERYQTVYGRSEVSCAAPTAGLHFTRGLLAEIKAKGVGIAEVELAVGPDTFAPVRAERVEDHRMHSEAYCLGPECAELVNSCRGRVVAVGTTSVRALESAALEARRLTGEGAPTGVGEGDRDGGLPRVVPFSGRTDLFIKPGHRFLAVDAIITNFHLPRSTLLMLVCAFGGMELVMRAYREAVEKRYRFYSFGDAMFIF